MNKMVEMYLEDFKDSHLLLNETLMKLQKGEKGKDIINSIFRVAHTIKGNSGGVEFFNIEKVMHKVEDILQEIRDGKRELNDDIVKLLFACHDFLEDAVEEIESTQSDKNIDITKMLAEIEKISGIEKLSDVKTAKTKDTVVGDKIINYGLPSMDPELISVIIENCRRGYHAHRLSVEFSPASQMKTVRLWMVLGKVDTHSTFVFSTPERPEEEELKNGSYDFEEDSIDIYIISDKDTDVLKNDILSISDIISVKLEELEIERLESEKERIQMEKKVLQLINDVEVNLLDMEKREINIIRLKNIENTLTSIVDIAEKSMDEYIVKTSQAILELIKRFEKNQSEVESGDIEVVAFMMHKVESMIGNRLLLADKQFCEEVDNILKATQNKFVGGKVKIGEILSEKNMIKNADVNDILQKQKDKYPDLKFGQVAVKEDKVSAYEMMKAMKEQPTNKDVIKENASIKVPINKVDSLMDMLGELLILNAQMEQKISEIAREDQGLNNVLSRSAKLIRGIQGLSMSLRMVEIKPTLHRLTRIARDTATELNKKITVDIVGEETDIDRSAVEKLFDPLMHLVRNAVSHGIETEDDRIRLGKPPEGRVSISVYSKRGSVYIEVEDDGKGINIDAVYQKAKRQGLVKEGKNYTEDDIIKFIFHPGFSMQEVVNTISGRGVGMNVVESEINKMGGKVEVINREGMGATFVIRIPMNLAVINGTIIEVSGGRYIVPTLFIKEFLIPHKENWVTMQGKNKAIKVRDHIIPVVTEKEIFGSNGGEERLEDKNIIILELEQKHLAFPVDKIVSRQEIVSKPLDKEFSAAGFASGASILGDGKVSVILDVEAMFKIGHN